MAGIADIVCLGVPPERAKVRCIFVHGRGQSPEEMEAAVIRRLSAEGVAYVLPRAEEGVWYRARAVDPLTVETREALGRSARDLAALVAQVRGAGGPVVLAGFSQGACLSLETVFTGEVVPEAVVAFTGCRVGTAGCARSTRLAAGVPVYLSGGDADPWIPVSAFAEAVGALGAAGAALRADVFPGRGHEVSDAEVAVLDGVLADLAAGRAVAMGAGR